MVHPDFVLGDPLNWLRLIEKHGVERTWAPNFAYVMVSRAVEEEIMMGQSQTILKLPDVSSVKSWINAGEQCTRATIERFVRNIPSVRIEKIVPSFGMAEACTCFTWACARGDKLELTPDNGPSLVNLGKDFGTTVDLRGKFQLPNFSDSEDEFQSTLKPNTVTNSIHPLIQLRITDENNTPIRTPNVIGRFQIRGITVTPGYLANEKANNAAFINDGESTWFNTGDCGMIDEEGNFAIAGRESETVVIRGVNLYCHEIEECVREELLSQSQQSRTSNKVPPENLLDGTCIAAISAPDSESGTEELGLVMCLTETNDINSNPKFHPITNALSLAKSARQALANRMGLHCRPIILPRNMFMKTTSGKLQRTAMKKKWIDGEYRDFDILGGGLEDLIGSVMVREWGPNLEEEEEGKDDSAFDDQDGEPEKVRFQDVLVLNTGANIASEKLASAFKYPCKGTYKHGSHTNSGSSFVTVSKSDLDDINFKSYDRVVLPFDFPSTTSGATNPYKSSGLKAKIEKYLSLLLPVAHAVKAASTQSTSNSETQI